MEVPVKIELFSVFTNFGKLAAKTEKYENFSLYGTRKKPNGKILIRTFLPIATVLIFKFVEPATSPLECLTVQLLSSS